MKKRGTRGSAVAQVRVEEREKCKKEADRRMEARLSDQIEIQLPSLGLDALLARP